MRLSQQDVQIIKKSLFKYISDAKTTLFGSRVYDDKKGGDIDIFVETSKIITWDTNRYGTLRHREKGWFDYKDAKLERVVYI